MAISGFVRNRSRKFSPVRSFPSAVESKEEQEFQELPTANRAARPLIAPLFACAIPRSVAWNPTPQKRIGGPDILWVEVLGDHDG